MMGTVASATAGRTGAALGLGILAWLCSTVPVHAAAPTAVGRTVELRMARDAAGDWRARRAEILSEPRSPKIRGPIESLDVAAEEFTIFGARLLVESSTRFETGHGLSSLSVGEVVEVRARPRAGSIWKAKSIAAAAAGSSWKVRGTLQEIHIHDDGTRIWTVDGLSLRLSDAARVRRDGSDLEEELFAVLREEDGISRSIGASRTPWGIGLSGSLRHHYRQERDFDLQDGSLRDLSEPSLRLELLSSLAEQWTAFAQLRWQGNFALRDEEFVPNFREETSLQVRQLYLTGRRVAGLPLGWTVGKQRLQDEREFLFDEYLDAIRVQFYGTRPLVLEASYLPSVAPLRDKFSTWDDALLRMRWISEDNWQAQVHALLRDDSSPRQRDSRYYGANVHGHGRWWRAWSEATLLRGRDKGQPQRAWAFDLGLALRASSRSGRPGFWLSMATGSGDDDPADGRRGAFRQTGYQDNSDRVWGVANLANYGEVLDPELSNLRVLTAGLSLRPRRNVSVDFVFHRYRLHRRSQDFDVTDLRIADKSLDGIHRGVGEEWSVVLGWRDLWPGLHSIVRWARFEPGEAFVAAPPAASRATLELRWDF